MASSAVSGALDALRALPCTVRDQPFRSGRRPSTMPMSEPGWKGPTTSDVASSAVLLSCCSPAFSSEQRSRTATYFETDTRPIILFDGVCNLCNGGVNFVLNWDTGVGCVATGVGAVRLPLPLQSAARRLSRKPRRICLSNIHS